MINRSQDLESLYDLMMSRENVLLHAPPGMGKTSLIHKLTQRLEGRRFCFSMNLRGLQTERQLLHRLLQTIHEKAEESYNLKYQFKRIVEERPVPVDITADSLTSWLKDLLVGLQNVSLDFLFVMEDADQWEGKSAIGDLFNNFFHSRNSQTLITSTMPLPGFEEICHYELLPLRLKNIDSSISEATSPERLEEVLALSAGNTRFFIKLVEAKALSNDSVRPSLSAILESYHPLYYNFRHRFTQLQWRLLLAIAAEGVVAQPHSFDFLVNYRLGAASSVERALRNLSDSGIIRQTGSGWQITEVIFQRWLEWLYPQKVEALSLQ